MIFKQYECNVRGLPLSAVTVTLHYLSRCLRSKVTRNKTSTIVTWSEHFEDLLPCNCYANPLASCLPLQAKEGTWVNLMLIVAWHH